MRWGEEEKEPQTKLPSSPKMKEKSIGGFFYVYFKKLWKTFKRNLGSSPPPPTSLKHEFYALTSGFTRLIMKTKYVCHGLISLHVNFHDNRKKRTVTLNIKSCRWGKRKKSRNLFRFRNTSYATV